MKTIILHLFCLLMVCMPTNNNAMLAKFGAYVSTKMPAVAALLAKRLKPVSSTPVVPAGHVISNIDGSPISQTQFNEIKTEILRPNEFPTALKNPDYNPDADETNVIQQKLDKKYANDVYTQRLYDPFHDHPVTDVKKTTVSWIPQTLHDLFIFEHSKNKDDEYKVNQKINNIITKNPKQSNESDIEYYQRLADPLVTEPFSKIFDITDNQLIYNDNVNAQMNNQANALHNPIAVETSLHNQKPSCVLLYRGNGSENDFNPDKANNQYLQKMASTFYWGIPLTLSYGLSLLSNAKKLDGTCPYVYAFRLNLSYWREPEQYKNHGDLQLLPVEKKDFNKQSGLWYVNPDYDYFNSVHANEGYFHPRAKGHSTQEMCENASQFNNKFDLKDGNRYTIHETQKEAFKKLRELKKYQINNAIGVTDYTKYKIQEAHKAYQQGKAKK